MHEDSSLICRDFWRCVRYPPRFCLFRFTRPQLFSHVVTDSGKYVRSILSDALDQRFVAAQQKLLSGRFDNIEIPLSSSPSVNQDQRQ